MGNNDAIDFYNKLSKKIINPLELRNKSKDTSDLDVAFIANYADKEKTLLDIGSGTGLLINHLYDKFKKIIAIEKYIEFSKYIVQNEKIEIKNENLLTFDYTQEDFDIATAFGSMHYFDEKESIKIYTEVFNNLPQDGIFIIKNQMGVDEDVLITHSDELNSDYFAQYRYVAKEIKNLETIGFTLVEKRDIYPSHYNRFTNTHFYALVLQKRVV